MAYRDDYEAMAHRCATLERELVAGREELERARRLRSLPLLDEIRVASPCHASWEAMDGDERVRFCGQCSKHVYNLSSLSRVDAERLIADTEGRICVRFYRRSDGTVLTADCPVGVRKLRVRRAVVAGVGAGILTTAAFFGLTVTAVATMGAPARPRAIDVDVNRAPPSPPPLFQGQSVIQGEPMPVPQPAKPAHDRLRSPIVGKMRLPDQK